MKYSVLSVLISWFFPTRKDRNKFRNFCEGIENRERINTAQKRYIKLISKIRKHTDENIKGLFVVNEKSKWKTQSL